MGNGIPVGVGGVSEEESEAEEEADGERGSRSCWRKERYDGRLNVNAAPYSRSVSGPSCEHLSNLDLISHSEERK